MPHTDSQQPSNKHLQTGSLPDLAAHEQLVHIKETITLLYLAVCQIETSVTDSNRSMLQLGNAFTQLAEHSNEIENETQAVKSPEEFHAIRDKISQSNNQIREKISEAITAFQFGDRLSQRLTHVTDALKNTTEILNSDQINSQDAWQDIQQQVKSSYSLDSERLMFEHILRGASVDEALEIYHHQFDETNHGTIDESGDEVELF